MVWGAAGAYVYPAALPEEPRKSFDTVKKEVGLKKTCQKFMDGR